MQTALKRVLRGNGDGRASRRQRRRIRMSIPRHGLCISQGTGTWPITEKRVSLAWRILDIYLRIEKSLARWTMLSWIRATGQFLCLRVGDASVMNNLWWQFHSCFAVYPSFLHVKRVQYGRIDLLFICARWFFFLTLLLYSKGYSQVFVLASETIERGIREKFLVSLTISIGYNWSNKFWPIFFCNFYVYLSKYIFNIEEERNKRRKLIFVTKVILEIAIFLWIWWKMKIF